MNCVNFVQLFAVIFLMTISWLVGRPATGNPPRGGSSGCAIHRLEFVRQSPTHAAVVVSCHWVSPAALHRCCASTGWTAVLGNAGWRWQRKRPCKQSRNAGSTCKYRVHRPRPTYRHEYKERNIYGEGQNL